MLAVEAHRGQLDKASSPYILHPLRLMVLMRTAPEMMTAVLHDVVEDSETTLEQLTKAGYPVDVLSALDCLTKRKSETYEEFIERLSSNGLARKVKLADLEDNMNLRRLPHPQAEDLQRFRKYQRAWARLSAIDSTTS